MKVAVISFPGSNCDDDVLHVLSNVLDLKAEKVWHRNSDLDSYGAAVLPGGFSYGDYLRSGAIARFSPAMAGIERMAREGKAILGICNGFQILLEAGLLPGAMLRNRGLKFLCRDVYLSVENIRTPFTRTLSPGEVLKIPIAHMDGNYYAPLNSLKEMKDNGQIVFHYCAKDGSLEENLFDVNPNGSMGSIAGICNREGNVLGMMPHPERCSEPVLGNTDGFKLFQSLKNFLLEKR